MALTLTRNNTPEIYFALHYLFLGARERKATVGTNYKRLPTVAATEMGGERERLALQG